MPTEEEALDNIRVGTRIRQLRENQGIYGSKLATWIGCSRVHIYNIEAGRSRATPEIRRSIALALHVTLADIEGDDPGQERAS